MQELLAVGEAARVCKVAPQTIRVWEGAGKLPAFRTEGGMRLFQRSDVERFKHERGKRSLAPDGAAA